MVRDDGTRTTASVARLVAMEYCQTDSFNRIVKHKDGNRYNNDADNLLWYISTKEKKQNLDDSIDKFCVYLHTCIANNKKYIGITSQVPEQRWANGKGYHNIEFCKDIERYGWKDGFLHEILFSNLTEKEACNIESEYIKTWDLQNPDIGYNVAKGGLQTTLGYRHTEDSKIKMSNALKERFKNKENHPWTNRKHKKESKDKMKINNPNRKPVISVENNKEYISIKEATRQMNLKSKNSIIIALKDNKRRLVVIIGFIRRRIKYMRDINRLDDFYLQLCNIHKKSFPDMREAQYMLNLLGWINSTKKRDPFFIETQEFLEYAKQYANSNSMWYQGWDVLNRKENDSGEN